MKGWTQRGKSWTSVVHTPTVIPCATLYFHCISLYFTISHCISLYFHCTFLYFPMLPCISLYFHTPPCIFTISPCTSIKEKQQSIILWFKISFNDLNHLFSPWLPLYFPVLPLYSHCTSGVQWSRLFFLGWTLILYRKRRIYRYIHMNFLRSVTNQIKVPEELKKTCRI